MFAIGAAAVAPRRILGRSLSVLTALVALVAAYAVAQAGHFGGELVYRHGAGVNTGGAAESAGGMAPEAVREVRHEEYGD